MELNIQIYSFVYSFFFGCVFYFLLDFFNKIVDKFNLFFKIIISLVFIISLSILYFILLLFINNGIVHIYFLLCILFGYLFVYKVVIPRFTHLRKK